MGDPAVSDPGKHHFIPVFYLKNWAGADGRLCEFSRPYNVVKPRRTHPDGTGYVRDLYTVSSLPADMRQIVEKTFMRRTDDLAARAMRVLLKGEKTDLSVETASGWSRFILSLLMRNPDFVARVKMQVRARYAGQMDELRTTYSTWKLPDDPETFEEFQAKMEPSSLDKAGAVFLQDIIDHRRLGAHINGMQWMIYTLHAPTHVLLTGDRPVVMSNGIGNPNSFIILPVNPTRFFLAVNQEEIIQRVQALLDRGKLAALLNNAIARQAQRHVYGTDDRQLRFVENRLTRTPDKTGQQLTWVLG